MGARLSRFAATAAFSLVVSISTDFTLAQSESQRKGEAVKPPAAASDSRIRSDERKVALPNAETATLENWVGSWTFVERHFDESGSVVATSKGQEDVIWILDKHAIRRTYTAVGTGSDFRAIGTMAWNAAAKCFEGTWFDNTSTSGPTKVRGEWIADTRTLVLQLESTAPDGKIVRHQSVEQFVDDERRTVTTYRLQGDDRIKAIDVEYKRTTPCPSKASGFRVVPDELQDSDHRRPGS